MRKIARKSGKPGFHDKISQRTYTALVWGDLKSESGTINEFIGRDRKNRMLMTVFPDKEFGKYAVTHYKVLERFGYVTRSVYICIAAR